MKKFTTCLTPHLTGMNEDRDFWVRQFHLLPRTLGGSKKSFSVFTILALRTII